MAGSIAAELLANINQVPYKQIIPALHGKSGIPETMFSRTTLAGRLSLDTRHWLDGSYMNPNALFEYFGLFSNETSKQVWKNMINFLGLNKKNGWKDCAILKNSWIALALQGITNEQWTKDMKKLDIPGDEIALYTLCKMYHCHCFIFTKAKSWCTVNTDSGLDEEELLDKCDIVLMFIEPGVYGELKSCPYAPPLGQALLQKVTADLPVPSTITSTDNKQTDGILDLTSPAEPVTNNITTANGNNTNPSGYTIDRPTPQPNTPVQPKEKNNNVNSGDSKPEQCSVTLGPMLKCMVNLTRLTEKDINMYMKEKTGVTIGGYRMRQ